MHIKSFYEGLWFLKTSPPEGSEGWGIKGIKARPTWCMPLQGLTQNFTEWSNMFKTVSCCWRNTSTGLDSEGPTMSLDWRAISRLWKQVCATAGCHGNQPIIVTGASRNAHVNSFHTYHILHSLHLLHTCLPSYSYITRCNPTTDISARRAVTGLKNLVASPCSLLMGGFQMA